MKTLTPNVLIFVSVPIGLMLAALACHRVSKGVPPPGALQSPVNKSSVSYKGISFTFDPSLASDVKSETIPASLEGKPSDIWPEHPGFTLVGYPKSRSMLETDPQIRVFEIAKFREAMQHAGEEMGKTLIPPIADDWAPSVDEEVSVLRTLLAKQPKSGELKAFLAKARAAEQKLDDFPQMPFLPLWEASQAFFARPKYVNFKGGRGVFFLTQWNVSDTSQVTNDGLEYAFQGMTDDGRYYVYAEFLVTAPFLPNDNDPDVAAWNEKNHSMPQKSRKYQEYLLPVVEKLQALPADKFKPDLRLLEQPIASMEVHPN